MGRPRRPAPPALAASVQHGSAVSKRRRFRGSAAISDMCHVRGLARAGAPCERVTDSPGRRPLAGGRRGGGAAARGPARVARPACCGEPGAGDGGRRCRCGGGYLDWPLIRPFAHHRRCCAASAGVNGAPTPAVSGKRCGDGGRNGAAPMHAGRRRRPDSPAAAAGCRSEGGMSRSTGAPQRHV